MTDIDGGLITLEDARKQVFNSDSPSEFDEDLILYVQAVTPIVEDIAGPVDDRSTSVTRTVGSSGSLLMPWPFRYVSAVTRDGAPVTGWTADGGAGIIRGLPADTTVTVTAQIGLTAVPANVRLAARELVRILWQQGRSGSTSTYVNTADAADAAASEVAVPRRIYQLLRPQRQRVGFA